MMKFQLLFFLVACPYRALYSQSFDELAYQGYLLYEKALVTNAKDIFQDAASILEKAAGQGEVSIEIRQTLLWDAAMIYGMAKDTVHTLKLLRSGLDAGMTDFEKINSRPIFDFLKLHNEWSALRDRFRKAEEAYVEQLNNPQLRKELLLMWAADQRVQFLLREKVRELHNNWGDPALEPFYKAVKTTDSLNFQRIQLIIEKSGWPKLSEVGRDGSFAAWAIVQHSNRIVFQEACAAAMTRLLQKKEVNSVDYANLVDRIRFNKKEKQLYGQAAKGYPIEDEKNLDNRRKAIGLVPMGVYAHLNGFEFELNKH